jgi:ABC-type transporter Mla MlaB component
MIDIQKTGNLVSITLCEESTIAGVEADLHLFAAQFADLKNVARVEIDGTLVAEIDTAYLQLLISAARTAKAKGAQFVISHSSDRFRELTALYGLNEGDLTGRELCPEAL